MTSYYQLTLIDPQATGSWHPWNTFVSQKFLVSWETQAGSFLKFGRQAALLLTLARLGADRGTLLAALLDGEDPHDDARQVGKIHH